MVLTRKHSFQTFWGSSSWAPLWSNSSRTNTLLVATCCWTIEPVLLRPLERLEGWGKSAFDLVIELWTLLVSCIFPGAIVRESSNMRHLTIVKLGYISPEKAIDNFFFHHCINCLQPLVKLAEYDSFSVTATFPGNKSVTLGVKSNSQNLSLFSWSVEQNNWQLEKPSTWKSTVFFDQGSKESNQQTPWNSIPFHFGPEIFIITSSFTALGPQLVIDILNSLTGVWSTSSTSLVDTHVHLKSITITHIHKYSILYAFETNHGTWKSRFEQENHRPQISNFLGGSLSMFEFCFLNGV